MDAIKLLGGLLGNRSGGGRTGGGGLGRDILARVLEKQRREQAAEKARQRGPTTTQHGGHSLEHVLHDVYGRRKARVIPAQREQTPPPQRTAHQPHEHHHHHGYNDQQLSERAVVLIRAMINAAKADGQIDQCEQDNIVERLQPLDPAEVQFLLSEFRRPLNVHEFAHDVPRGMEQEVYAISLMAIDLDTNPEANYLRELAECLRIAPNLCNDIHNHYSAPCLYR
ncbi:MAG: tellurite resistance TerB family protein [Aeoliella sp.]